LRRRTPSNRAERRRAERRAADPRARTGAGRPRRDVLAALTAGALSLPGLAGSAGAQGPAEGPTLQYAPSYYWEDELDEGDVADGSETERYEIWSHQFKVVAPFTPRSDLELDVMYESLSGATPWFVQPDGDGDPEVVMTGATIEETRVDVLGRANYYLDNGLAAIQGGVSTENDYFAANGGFELQVDFNDDNTSVGMGAGFSFDTIEPTDADDFATRVKSEDKQSYTVFGSVSQVLSPSAIVQAGVNWQLSKGFLSDPYKLVSVGGVNIADDRPQSRSQVTVYGRYRQHIAPLAASLHLDYAYSTDDWDIDAHTLELAWYQTFFERYRIIPSVRYYTQTGADFYDVFFPVLAEPRNVSSDYRLSPFGALSWKLRAEADVPRFRIPWTRVEMEPRFGASWERYLSDAEWALQGANEANPGLVSFQVLRLDLTLLF